MNSAHMLWESGACHPNTHTYIHVQVRGNFFQSDGDNYTICHWLHKRDEMDEKRLAIVKEKADAVQVKMSPVKCLGVFFPLKRG